MVENERRRMQRHRTFKAGLIAFNRAGTIECQVRNLSPIGARLDVASQIGIPDEFLLLVEHEKLKQNCRVIWRKPMQLGVEFVSNGSRQDEAVEQAATA